MKETDHNENNKSNMAPSASELLCHEIVLSPSQLSHFTRVARLSAQSLNALNISKNYLHISNCLELKILKYLENSESIKLKFFNLDLGQVIQRKNKLFASKNFQKIEP